MTIPKAYIISHDAQLNDTAEVIFDIANHTERANVAQFVSVFNEKKKIEDEINGDTEPSGLLGRAQQSAKKQLEFLLNAITTEAQIRTPCR